MNRAADLMLAAAKAGLVLSRADERIHVESPLGRPLPEGLGEAIRRHRAELQAWFSWCEVADADLLALSGRLELHYPQGCPLGSDIWRAAEDGLNAAYLSQDSTIWREALAAYERFALDWFTAYEKEHDDAR